jgi:hypothetical protein
MMPLAWSATAPAARFFATDGAVLGVEPVKVHRPLAWRWN